jgi:hypothetical protein
VNGLTPTEKGGIAELAIASAAARLGIVVCRPMTEGRRYDFVFDADHQLLRVQCKWGTREGDIVRCRLSTARHSPVTGYIRTTYTVEEVDAVAIYCHELNSVYLLPIEEVAGQTYLHLRLTPARNNQQRGCRMADDYRLGAVAQLGERPAGSREVRGSSPLSSTS